MLTGTGYDKTLTFYYGTPTGTEGTDYFLTDNTGMTEPGWSGNRSQIKSVVFASSYASARPTSCYHWFYDCIYLTSITGIRYLNTSNVTNMKSMFYKCSSLASLDVSGFDTSNVTNMQSMFYLCGNLTELDLTNFNTSNVTNMQSMFYNCTSLTSLTFGENFTTKNVTSGTGTFNGCSKLRYIDFYACDDTDAITSVDRNIGMFNGVPETTVIFLPKGSDDVTDVTNVVYSKAVVGGADSNSSYLACSRYYSEDKVDIEIPRKFQANEAVYTHAMNNSYGSVVQPYAFTTNDKI